MIASEFKNDMRWRLAQARKLHDLGLIFVPVYGIKDGVCSCAKKAACEKPGKHPSGDNWVSRGTRDWATIERWIKAGGNVGLLMRDHIGLDFDGPVGLATLAYLEGIYPELRKTLRQRTQGGGVHVIFRAPKELTGEE